MAEDNGELVQGSSSKAVKTNPIPKRWARQAKKAAAALKLNAMALEDGPLPSDEVLRARGYVTIPGEKLAPQRVPQPLRRQDLSTAPALVGKKR